MQASGRWLMAQHKDHKALEERQREHAEKVTKPLNVEHSDDKPRPRSWHHRPGEDDDQT